MAIKNALQNALNLAKSGALRAASATPIGQLASRVAQAASFLRAPSMEDLGSAYNQSVGRASSFVQKYPSPASYVAQRPQIQPAVRTFQENMRLLSRPMQSLTTETPAARFLFNKIGGPAQYAKIQGPPTVGKYIAGTVEQAFPALLPFSPYVPTIVSGLKATPGLLPKIAAGVTELATLNPRMKVRNILKQGLNIPAGVVGTGVATGIQAGLKLLKGEKMSKEELASSSLFGFAVGALTPSPMKGIATTDLGAVRRTLSNYGFKLKDYENPTLLKTKFRSTIMRLHPDKGGNPEEFKTFIDAYNKATSAGIDSSWKFPDIMGWVKNLWTKKQQPTPGGLKLRTPIAPTTTTTEGLFGKIATTVQKESGDGFHTFEGPQIRMVLKKAGLTTIPEGIIETPGFIVQYRKKDYLGNPIPPVLQVNLFPEDQQTQPLVQPTTQPVAPRVVQVPIAQPITPIPQVPKTITPIQPQATKKVSGIPTTPIIEEPPSPALIDYFREMARTVNVDEIVKLNSMSTSDANKYVAQQMIIPSQPPSTEGVGGVADLPNNFKQTIQPLVDKYGLSDYNNEDYSSFKITLDRDKTTGYAIKPDGELISVFNTGKKGNGAIALEDAIENGATKLDVFDHPKLINFYKKFGFEESSRIKWDDQYAPDNWDYTKRGRPDIVYMELNKEKYAGYKNSKQIREQTQNAGVSDISRQSGPVFERNFRSIGSGTSGVGQGNLQSPTTIPQVTQQVTPIIPQVPPVQSTIMPQQPPGTQETQVPTLSPKETGEKKVFGFTKTVLKSETAAEEFKQKILNEMKDHYYQVLHNKDVVEEAQRMITENKDATLQRVLNVNDLDTTLNAAGEILEYQAQHEGDLVLSDQIHKVLMEKMLRAGQQGQIARIWAGMTPEGRLHFADTMTRIAKDKMSTLDKFSNRTGMIEEAPVVAKKAGEKFNKANDEVLDTVLKDVKEKSKDIKRKTTDQEVEISPDELLGKRIIRYVKSLLTSPLKEQDPIKIMVDTLYKVALEVLPKKTPIKKDPLEFIASAIKDKKGYGEAWDLAREIVKEKFADKPEALTHLDNYFAHILDRPFTQAQLNQAVSTRLKEGKIDIVEVVRDYYTEKQKLIGESLATRLSQEAGLTDEDARMLEKYVIQRFSELTKTKKIQILDSMMRETPQLLKHRTYLQKLIEMSNLGAFNDRKYYDMLAKRFNIPNISEKLATQIYTITQNIQTLTPGAERDKQVQNVMNLVSDQLPLNYIDVWDAYRKNNMLSGPGSNMRNAYSNALVTSVLVPLNLVNMVVNDVIFSTLKGKERQFYASMVPAYVKASLRSIPLAVDRFKAAWQGEMPVDDPTLKELNYVRIRRAFPRMSIPTRFLEASDQLFQTVISEGVSAAFQANSMTKEQADEYGLKIAKQELFKSPLDPQNKTDQGKWMAAIDRATTGLLQIRTGIKPLDWALPFVVVPALWAKQSIRYTAPFSTFISQQIEDPVMRGYQRGATYTGFTFLFIASALALNGLTEWEGEKKDETLRTAGYDAGRRDYSIKIGNAYIPLWYFGPLFFSMALPIAIRHYWITSRTAKTDSDIKKISRVGLGLVKAYTSATFLKNIGDLFKTLNGEVDSSWSNYAANYASQNIYYSGLLRWISMLVDDTYRKSDSFWEAIQKGLPFLSKTLEPYYTLKGEPSKRNVTATLGPYPIGIENPEAYYIFTERNHTLQNYNVINEVIKGIDFPPNVKKDSEEGLTYVDSHPETQYISILTTFKNKLSDLSGERLKVYTDKQMSTEEKNTSLNDIDTQQKDVLDQAYEVIKEIRNAQGKPEVRNMFDQVEATAYAEDFKEGMKIVETVRQEALAKNQSEFEKIRTLADQKEKFKKIRERFDWDMKLKRDDFTRGKEAAAKVGVNPSIAEYDWWSAQDLAERSIHIHSLIEGKSGNDTWDTLVSLRKESPGTGNMVLSNQLVSDLVDEGYISKSTGTQLRKVRIKTDTSGSPLLNIRSGTSTGGSNMAFLKQISTLMEQRGEAVQKALKIRSPRIKIPKIAFPKTPKTPRIRIKPLTVSSDRFVLKAPKRTSIKIPGRVKNLVHARRSF